MRRYLYWFDEYLIRVLRTWSLPAARAAIAITFAWFGVLKLFDLSPAESLVHALFTRTVPVLNFGTFMTFFALFEIGIGLLFLVRGLERLAIFLLALHLVMTALPLVFLPQMTWDGWFVPTLTGQYIIKNVLIVALAMVIGSGLVPMMAPDARARQPLVGVGNR